MSSDLTGVRCAGGGLLSFRGNEQDDDGRTYAVYDCSCRYGVHVVEVTRGNTP